MRVRTNATRVALGLIVALATVVPAVTLSVTPALAHHCSGEGRIDQRGGDVVGECHGQTPGQPGGGTVHETWDIYCAAAVGEYREGDAVEFEAMDQLSAGDVENLG
ncbi:MAG: hypothetical protein P1T08_18985, partial [Acidimicrobiia bacterium]|nr:hypothetical protein [Acidimicrobiia bacterium]